VRKRSRGKAEPHTPPLLQYKVVELSTVDEGSIEEAINGWTRQGWAYEGLQFAMRESSKRPAMAFVFFTRPGEAVPRDEAEAHSHLRRLASDPGDARLRPVSALERLAQLAEDDPEEGG